MVKFLVKLNHDFNDTESARNGSTQERRLRCVVRGREPSRVRKIPLIGYNDPERPPSLSSSAGQAIEPEYGTWKWMGSRLD